MGGLQNEKEFWLIFFLSVIYIVIFSENFTPFCDIILIMASGAVGSVGRASRSQREGRRFKSDTVHIFEKRRNDIMDANGLDPEQQTLLASIMGKSPQAGGGGAFTAAQAAPAPSPAAAAPAAAPADPGRMLSQEEIDALIASMTQ